MPSDPRYDLESLKQELKQLIVQACHKNIDPGTIADHDALIGPDAALGLDSLDVLQVNMAIMARYGVRIEDGKQARRVMRSVETLAEFLRNAARNPAR